MFNAEAQRALDVVRTLLDCYRRRDVDGCMATIAADAPLLLLGTNEDEVFSTAEEVRGSFAHDFAGMTDIHIGEPTQLRAEASATLASVIVEVPIAYTAEGSRAHAHIRYALTLVHEHEAWKICAGVASVPFPAGAYPSTG